MSTQQQEVITASEVKQADSERRSLLATFAEKYGLEANNMMRTLRSTVFRPNKDGVEPSNEQVAAFLIVANQHSLNPFTKEIHGFLDKRGGIVAVVGLDGWAKKINEHQQFDGMTFEQDDEKCTCTMYRKDRKYPTVHTEWMAECKRPTEPWSTHPKRMLNWKALIQTARIAFGFAGIYEPDEAERIVEAVDAEIDVTPAKPKLQLNDEGKPEFVNADGSPHVPTKKIGPKRMRTIVEKIEAATKAEDGPGLLQILDELDNDEKLQVFQNLRSWDKTEVRALEKKARDAAGPAPHLGPWALELLGTCKDEAARAAAWLAIQGAYDANGTTPPADIETVNQDLKAELAK